MALKRSRAGESGFTLVESLVAMAVLMFGLLALAMLQNVSYRANTLARNRSAATILAHERIERLSRLGAETLTSGSASRVVDGMTFSESWTAAGAPNVNNDAQTVELEVEWTDQWGQHTVSYPTVLR